MVKLATSWRPSDSGTITAPYSGYKALLQTGDYILLQTGFKILFEGGLVTTKNPTLWSAN